MVGPVNFEMDPRDLRRPWRRRDGGGRVDIGFEPEGGKKIHLGALGHYDQKCGRFSGTLVDGSGEGHEVRDYYGCAESMVILS